MQEASSSNFKKNVDTLVHIIWYLFAQDISVESIVEIELGKFSSQDFYQVWFWLQDYQSGPRIGFFSTNLDFLECLAFIMYHFSIAGLFMRLFCSF